MTYSSIVRCVASLPDKNTPGVLSRSTVTPHDFLRYPAIRSDMPSLAMIEAAIEAGRG
jgi:hypothetical protein